MGRWVKKWWWLCLIIGIMILVIGWKERRCQAQAGKCRADYAAQESRLLGFSVDGNAAEQDAINEACEPNGYFCRLFSSANLPTWFLVFVGFGGVWAAIRTLRAIESQSVNSRKEVVLLNRAYLTVGNWTFGCLDENKIAASFRIYNPSHTAARIETIEFKCGETTSKSTCGRLLTPREGYFVPLVVEEIVPIQVKTYLISGRITYTDIFRRERHRRFAQYCTYSHPAGQGAMASFSDAEGVGWNDEEEWDKQDD